MSKFKVNNKPANPVQQNTKFIQLGSFLKVIKSFPQ